MADEGIHDHVEDCGGQGVALRHALAPLERASEVSAGPDHHGQLVPVRPQELERTGTNPIRRNNIKASIPIQGIICLLEVQENFKEDRLPHDRELLEQLGL